MQITDQRQQVDIMEVRFLIIAEPIVESPRQLSAILTYEMRHTP